MAEPVFPIRAPCGYAPRGDSLTILIKRLATFQSACPPTERPGRLFPSLPPFANRSPIPGTAAGPPRSGLGAKVGGHSAHTPQRRGLWRQPGREAGGTGPENTRQGRRLVCLFVLAGSPRSQADRCGLGTGWWRRSGRRCPIRIRIPLYPVAWPACGGAHPCHRRRGSYRPWTECRLDGQPPPIDGDANELLMILNDTGVHIRWW